MAEKEMFPSSDLDLNLMLTNSLWGRESIPDDLRDNLMQLTTKVVKKGTRIIVDGKEQTADKDTVVFVHDTAWAQLGFYTRDQRLGNLDSADIAICDWANLLCGDVLGDIMDGVIDADVFPVLLNRAASRLELSQSRKGFLRKQANTFRTEKLSTEIEGRAKSSQILNRGGK